MSANLGMRPSPSPDGSVLKAVPSLRCSDCEDGDQGYVCPACVEAFNPVGFGCTEDPDFVCDGTCSECEVNQ